MGRGGDGERGARDHTSRGERNNSSTQIQDYQPTFTCKWGEAPLCQRLDPLSLKLPSPPHLLPSPLLFGLLTMGLGSVRKCCIKSLTHFLPLNLWGVVRVWG